MTGWFSGLRGAKKLPDCTGPFAVGCTDFMCAQSEVHGVEAQHGSFLRLFYPSENHNLDGDDLLRKQTLWFPRSEYSWGIANFVNLPSWLLGGLVQWAVGHVRIPAIENAPLGHFTHGSKGLPCVVFSHGLGANRLMYSTYCCELASHGCVVAMVEHRDRSASATFTYVVKDNEEKVELFEEWIPFYKKTEEDDEFKLRNTQLNQRRDECVSALNVLEHLQQGTLPMNLISNGQHFNLGQFKGQLNLQQTALIGHSFGGATVVTTLAKEKRFRCGVALDVWMLPLGTEIRDQQIDQPMFFINSYQFHKWRENIDELSKLVQINPDTRPVIAVRKTSHMSQCDIVLVSSFYMSWFTSWRSNQLDAFVADGIYKRAMWTFLCRNLGIGNPAVHEPVLDGGDDVPEHVIIGIQDQSNAHL